VSVALSIQYAERMRRIILSVACLSVHIFPLYLINGTIFGEKVVEQKMWFWFFLQYCLKHFSLYEEIGEILS